MTPSEELRIIERVKRGDAAAFEALVIENQKKVYNLAYRMTGHEQDALDLSQDAFLRAYTSLGAFRGDSRFSVWLYRLAYNLCVDFLRRRRPVSPLEYEDGDGKPRELEIPDLRAEPQTETERRETRKAISRSIDALPDKLRQTLVLREISGMSYAEIADTLGENEGTVKSRINRARLRLAELLIKDGTFPPPVRHKEKRRCEHD